MPDYIIRTLDDSGLCVDWGSCPTLALAEDAARMLIEQGRDAWVVIPRARMDVMLDRILEDIHP